MKKIRIEARSQEYNIGGLIKRTARIGIGLVMTISLFLNWFFFGDLIHANQYEKVVEECESQEEKIRLNGEFFNCIREATSSSSDRMKATDVDSQLEEIDKYLQDKKVNINNLNIYLFRKEWFKSDKQKNHWMLVRGGELFAISLTKTLMVDSLTKSIKLLQNYVPKKVKTQEFLFCSELIIKVFVFALLIRLLQTEQFSNEKLGALVSPDREIQSRKFILEILELCCSFINLIPLDTFFISTALPLSIQRITTFKWTIIYILIIVANSLLEEYSEDKKGKFYRDEEEKIFLRASFYFRIIMRIIFFSMTALWFKWWRNEDYPKRNNLATKRIRTILFLTLQTSSNLINSVENLNKNRSVKML